MTFSPDSVVVFEASIRETNPCCHRHRVQQDAKIIKTDTEGTHDPSIRERPRTSLFGGRRGCGGGGGGEGRSVAIHDRIDKGETGDGTGPQALARARLCASRPREREETRQ